MKINQNFFKIESSYLFSTVARKQREYQEAHPEADIIRLSIGDVTRPLVPSVIDAMHKAVDEMANEATFRGYPPEHGYEFILDAIQQHDYAARGVNIEKDEIFLSDGAKPTNKQEDIQLKAVVLLLSCRIMTLLFSFAPYNLLKMVARNRAAPYEFIRKQRATIIGKPYNVCQMPLEVSCFCWTSDTVNKPSLYIDLITAWSFMAVT